MTRRPRVPPVTSHSDYDTVRLYVAGSLHAHFMRADYRGLSSYKPRPHCWCVEIVLKDGVIELEYDERELWLAVLKTLDEVV